MGTVATPTPAPLGDSNRFQFQKDGKFLDNQVGASIVVDATKSPAVAQALLTNTPFPAGTLQLGTVSAKLEGGTGDLKFGGGQNGSVAFSGSGGLRAGLGVYSLPTDMVTDLGGDAQLLEGIAFENLGARRFVALYWGYDIKAAANGSLALGAGTTVNFGVDGSSDGLFAVVRGFSQDPLAATAVGDVITSWRLPRQIDNAANLAPGTWIIAEVDGAIGVKIGAQFGYNYSWIRKVQLEGLSGDIGLKIQAAAEVAIGFNASGKYALIVGRESLDANDQVLRIRLHKMAKKGFSFALDASLGIQGSTGKLLPEKLDDFIAGILGIHGQQILQDLQVVRKLTNPEVPFSHVASDFLLDFAQKELSTIVDIPMRFAEAKKRVVDLLDKWDQLGGRASDILFGAVRKADPAFETAIKAIADADDTKLKSIFTAELEKVDFFRSPLGQFLVAQAPTGVLALLNNTGAREEIQKAASLVRDILDAKVLKNLIDFVDQRFKLDDIRNLSLDQIDQRLKEKLAAFLGKVLDQTGLDTIRKVINQLLNKGDKLYAEGLKALNKKYTFEVHASYQKTTTSTALLDVEFDFAKNPNLTAALAAAIGGDFEALFEHPSDGVKTREAVLTHGVSRHSHIDFSMPYFTGSGDTLNESLAKMTVQEENGSLYLFDLDASDETVQIRNNQNRWASRLAVSMKMAAAAGADIRHYGDLNELGNSMTSTYAFQRAVPNMTTNQLEKQLEPLVKTYLPGEFGVPGKASLHEWTIDLDKLFDQLENNGTGQLGNTLLSLDVSVPGNILAGWLRAPADGKAAVYLDLSRRIQTILKRLIPFCYFQNLANYKGGNSTAGAVMTYAAISPVNQLRLEDGHAVAASHPDPYWDVFDKHLVTAMTDGSILTHQNLAVEMDSVRQILQSTPDLKGEAGFYEQGQLARFLGSALQGPGLNLLMNSLLFTEAEVIRAAVEGGQSIAQFRAQAANKPARAVESLAAFGHKITSAFNSKLTSLFDPKQDRDLLRNFGLTVFIEASRSFQDLGTVQPTAMLDVAILRKNAEFPPKNFPHNDPVPADVIGVEQHVISLPA